MLDNLVSALDVRRGDSCHRLAAPVWMPVRFVRLASMLRLDRERVRSVQLEAQMRTWIRQPRVPHATAGHMLAAVKYSALYAQPGSLIVTAMRQHHVWNVQQVSTGWPQDRSIRF